MALKTGKVKFILFLFFVPIFSFAAAATLTSVKNDLFTLINTFAKLFTALGLVYFFYGLGTYMAVGVDEKKKKAAKDTMIYGLIGLFVIFSINGIILLVKGTLGL